ncbi:prmC [Symbiodinium natans]|uniref:PrmC protein n=1 Tax=Symbiodinium natans TaxID=878477 RepID=A0A812MIJ4_9DINO|nr:prmC [Symbiodinium natans]
MAAALMQAVVSEEEKEATLLPFVHARFRHLLPSWFSKKVARFRIGDGLVSVNGRTERFLHHPLKPGDVVCIDAKQVRAAQLLRRRREEAPLLRDQDGADRTTSLRSLRLLEWLHLKEGLSLKEARCAIREGRVKIDGVPVEDPARLVPPSSAVAQAPAIEAEDPDALGVRVLHEESGFAVAWKPAGISASDCAAALPKMGVPGDPGYPKAASSVEQSLCGLVLVATSASGWRLLCRALGNEEAVKEEFMEPKELRAARCHFLVVVDCEASAPGNEWRPGDGPFELLRPWRSTRWIRGRGQLQVLECICPAPLPGSKLFASSLANLGYHILGRKGTRGRPLKCVLAWSLDLPQGCFEFRAEAPAQMLKAFEAACATWRRHQEALSARQGRLPEEERAAPGETAASATQIAYARGWELFCSHRFQVSDAVMVPRRGTEVVAQRVCQALGAVKKPGPLRLLDLGTGSGCIAISALLDLQGSDAEAVGLDSSAEALAVATRNAELLLRNPQRFQAVDLLQLLLV